LYEQIFDYFEQLRFPFATALVMPRTKDSSPATGNGFAPDSTVSSLFYEIKRPKAMEIGLVFMFEQVGFILHSDHTVEGSDLATHHKRRVP